MRQPRDIDVQLVPSAAQFGQRANAELKKVQLDKEVNLDVDSARLEAGLAEARARLEALQRQRTDPQIGADITAATARIREISARLTELDRKESTPKIDANAAGLRAELVRAEGELNRLQQKRTDPHVGADIKVLQAEIRRGQQELDAINRERAEPHIGADTSAAEGQLNKVRSRLESLRRMNVSPRVDAQVTGAEAKVLQIRAELDRLAAMRPSPTVDANIASATAKLRMIDAQLAMLGGRRTDVNISSGNLPSIPPILVAIVAGLAALASAAGPAAAALAAIPAALSGAAQGIGAIMAGFSGVSEAISGVESAQKSAGAAGSSAGKQQESAARGVESAQRSLQQAQIQQARTAIQGAQQVASAERALEAARIQAARTAIQSAQQIASAQRALAAAQIQAARSVTDAQKAYTRSLQQEKYAQEDLTRARKEAQRALADLQLQTSGAALSQERAQINLQRAQQALAEANASGMPDSLDKKELVLSVKEAEQAVKETQNSYKNLKEDSADWARTGVEGSRGVVAAQRSLLAAQQAVGDSAIQVSRAQQDGARSVQDAQIALAQAVQQAGWAQQDAARGVRDAEIALSQARQQAAWANQDAARAVEDAQRALAEAYKSAGEAGAAGANKVEDALRGLSPAAREFVMFMVNEFKPAWKQVSDAVATEMLPRIQQALRKTIELVPIFRDGLSETGRVIGDLAIKGAEMMTSGPWKADFATIMSSNNRSMTSFGNAGLSVADAFRSIIVASLPLIERFARAVEVGAELFNTWIQGKRDSGELGRWFQEMGDKLSILWGAFKDTAKWAWDMLMKLQPMGDWLIQNLPLFRDIGTAVMDGLVAAFKTLAPILQPILEVLASLARGFSGLPEPVQGAIAVFGLLALGAGKLLLAIGRIGPGVAGAAVAIGRLVKGDIGGAFDALTGRADRAGRDSGKALGDGIGTGKDNAVRKAGDVTDAAGKGATRSWLGAFSRVAGGVGLVLLAVELDKAMGNPIRDLLNDLGGLKIGAQDTSQSFSGSINRMLEVSPRNPSEGWGDFRNWGDEFTKMFGNMPSIASEGMIQVNRAISSGMLQVPAEVMAAGNQAVERFKGALAAMPEAARTTAAGTAEATRQALLPAMPQTGADAARQTMDNLTKPLSGPGVVTMENRGTGLASAFGIGVGGLPDIAGGAATDATQRVAGGLGPMANQGGLAAQRTTGALGRGLAPAPDIAGTAGSGVANSMFGGMLGMPGQTGDIANQTTGALQNGTNGMPGLAGDTGTQSTDRMNKGLGPMSDNAMRVGRQTVDNLNGSVRGLPNDMGNIGQQAGDSFGDKIVRALESAARAVGNVIDGIVRSVGNAISSITQSISGISSQGGVGFRPMAQGGLIAPMADGGLLSRQPVVANAGGNSLTPMSGRNATMVPANTWRVVGDNMTVPELFAPLNGSSRTRNLLAEAAAHEGFAMVARSAITGMAQARNGREPLQPVGRYALGAVIAPARPYVPNVKAASATSASRTTTVGATQTPLIGENNIYLQGSDSTVREALESTMFVVRRARAGGVHK